MEMADPIHYCKGVGRLTTSVYTEGKGSYIATKEGKKFLDFTSGIGVTNLGHCHPKVTKAAQEQCAKIVHVTVSQKLMIQYKEAIKERDGI